MKRSVCLILLMWTAFLLTRGQDSTIVFDMRSGLPENRIRAVGQMADGRIAIATTATVEVYDGTRFRSYSLPPDCAFPLPAYNGTRQLTCDSEGRIWLRNSGTLHVVDTRRQSVVADVDSLLHRLGLTGEAVAAWPVEPRCGGDTTARFTDSYGGRWTGTRENGLYYTHSLRARQFVTSEEPFTHRRLPKSVSEEAGRIAARYAPSATNCTLESGGYTYLGTRSGVFVVRPSDTGQGDTLAAIIGQDYGLLTDNIAALMADPRGDIWAATSGGGITRLHATGRDSFRITNYGLPDGIRTAGQEFRNCQMYRDTLTGRITAGFVGGTVSFHPDSVNAPRYSFRYPAPAAATRPAPAPGYYRWWLLLLLLAAAVLSGFLLRRKRSRKSARTAHDIGKTVEKTVAKLTAEGETAPTADELFVRKLQEAVEQHLGDEDFSVQQLSDMMAMDRTVLYRRMQQLSLGSPSVYIKSIRIRVAERLLTETAMPIGEIAVKTGFSSAKYFSAAFRESTGMLPRTYRELRVKSEE